MQLCMLMNKPSNIELINTYFAKTKANKLLFPFCELKVMYFCSFRRFYWYLN